MLVYIKPLTVFPKLHSDTLFGAMTSAINDLFPQKVEEMIKSFEDNNPPFLITSAFPYAVREKIRFYPKVISSGSMDSVENRDSMKAFKKIEFVDEETFFNLVNGNLSEADILNDYDNYFTSKNLLMKEPCEDIGSSTSITPHNSVNRLTNETEAIFYGEGTEYGNMGLFFFVELLDDEYENIIKSALKYLKDRGFGRDISTGKGQFDYEIEDISIHDLNEFKGDRFVTLSRFIPTDAELDGIDINASYEIGSKQGRAASGEIRKQVKFFKEGSTFSNDIKGKIIRSGKDNPAVEFGYAFPVRIGGD